MRALGLAVCACSLSFCRGFCALGKSASMYRNPGTRGTRGGCGRAGGAAAVGRGKGQGERGAGFETSRQKFMCNDTSARCVWLVSQSPCMRHREKLEGASRYTGTLPCRSPAWARSRSAEGLGSGVLKPGRAAICIYNMNTSVHVQQRPLYSCTCVCWDRACVLMHTATGIECVSIG